MARIEPPFPPGDYDVVVVGSGPAGLQMAYCLTRLGVRHAVVSRDDGPGGMFRRFPIFERLISWTKPDAPFERGTREYQWYDHNSLIADERQYNALVPEFMDRTFDVPARGEMETALAAFAERTRLQVRYGCQWNATRRDEDGFVLETADGDYRCRALVLAIGVTEAWKPSIPGVEYAPHYVDTRPARSYQGKRVFIVGKRNSGFEIAHGLLPWARQVVLASPRPVETAVLGRSPLRVRYLQPYDEYTRGGSGSYVLDAAIERIERWGEGFRVVARGTTASADFEFEVDDVIAATGFQTPLCDLPALGLATVADGRIPALTPYWESVSLPGVYFAGNATQGARGLAKHGVASNSTAVNGFRYNARALARHLAETRFGVARERRVIGPERVVPYLLSELARAPELWIQKGYLARVLTVSDRGVEDAGIVPLEHFVDAAGADGVAAAVEMDGEGTIYPGLYVRRGGRLDEHVLPPNPLHDFGGDAYRRELEDRLRPLLA